MKKLITVVLFLTVAVSSLYAQDTAKKKIKLKSGIELVGVVTTEDGMTKITIDNGDVFYYMPADIKEISEIEKTRAEKENEKQALKQAKKDSRIQNKATRSNGYFGTVGVNSTLGSFTARLTTIHGYFNKGFHIGVGVGIGIHNHMYVEEDWDGKMRAYDYPFISIPAYLHISQELTRTKVAPFIGVNAGFDLGGAMEFSNWTYALIIQPVAGLNIKLKKTALRIGGGYDLYYGPVVNLAVKF